MENLLSMEKGNYLFSLISQKYSRIYFSFNRGLNQIMIVKSRTFGEFPAIILSLGENCLTVRSVIKGDPRHITITKADLESGRVKISKKGTT